MYDLNSTVSIVSLLISTMGILLTFWFTRSPRPYYSLYLAKLGGINHPDISIAFNKKKVLNLYSLRLVFWNGGRKEIRKRDIPKPKAGPMLQISENAKLLKLSVLTTTGDDSGKFTSLDNNLFINFDYLNPKDAFLGEIYLTTKDDKKPTINFSGSLKGFPISEGDMVNISKFDHIFFSTLAIIFLYITILIGYTFYDTFPSLETSKIIKYIISLLILGISNFVLIKYNIFSIPRKIPKKYLTYLETGELQ